MQVIPAALNFASSATEAIGSRLGQAWDAMANDPWGTLAMVGVVAAGVALCFVAGPVGVGILIGAGLAAGMGAASGNFNPRSVAIGGVIGGLTAGVGSGASLGTTLAVGGAAGGGSSVAEQTIAQGKGLGNVNWTSVAISTGAGMAISGAARGLSSSGATGSSPGGGDRVLFGQESVSRSFTSAERGSTFKYAGENVADASTGLRNGAISPNEIPVDYIVHNGQRVAFNNRSLLTLRRAGLEPTVTNDVTADAVVRSRVLGRLEEMGGAPSETIRVRGAGPNASYLDWLGG